MRLRHTALILQLLVCLPNLATAAPPYTWAHSYGDDATQTLTSVATDNAGNVLVCGTFFGSMTFSTTITASGTAQPDIFIAKLDPAGNALWNKKIGLLFNDEGWDIVADKDNNVIVVGTTSDSFGNANVLVTKYNPAGTQLFQKTFGENGASEYAQFVSVDLAGNIIVAGKFGYEIDFGGGPILAPGFDGEAMFLAKLDANGNHIWSKAFKWGVETGLGGLETDALGDVFLHGQFQNTINFGASDLTSNGATDLFLVKFTLDGRVAWNHNYGSANADNAVCLAVTPDGRSAFAENLYNAVDFGGGLLTPTGVPQPAVALFTTNGTHVWSKTFTATAYAFAYGMTFAENKDLLLTCHTSSGTVNFGGGPIAPIGTSYNVFVARFFGSNGGHRWSFAFGGDGNVYGFPSVAHGSIVVAGYMDGAANPGGGALPYEGENDVFVARFGETLTGVGVSPMMAVLYQNVPNPFNPTTSIPYMLEMGRRVEIGIYDVSGSRVVVLNEGLQSPGTHTAIWNGRDQSGRAVPSGVYFYRFEGIPDAVGSRKMVLLK